MKKYRIFVFGVFYWMAMWFDFICRLITPFRLEHSHPPPNQKEERVMVIKQALCEWEPKFFFEKDTMIPTRSGVDTRATQVAYKRL